MLFVVYWGVYYLSYYKYKFNFYYQFIFYKIKIIFIHLLMDNFSLIDIDNIRINNESSIIIDEQYNYFLSMSQQESSYRFNIIIYLVLTISVIIAFYLLYYSYYKYKHSFWHCQPVQHYHFLSTYTNKFSIIKNDLRELDYNNHKYIDPYISNYLSNNFNKKEGLIVLKHIEDIVSNHYLREKDIYYIPKLTDIKSYFSGHIEPFYLGVKNINDLVSGCITARPVYIHSKKHKYKVFSQHNYNNQCIYYVDFLTVERKSRKLGIAPKMIQTMISNISNNITPSTICLFKHEGNNKAPYKPIIKYNISVFDITEWSLKTFKELSFLSTDRIKQYEILKITQKNKHMLRENITSILNNFDYSFHTYIENLYSLIETENIFIYLLKDIERNTICGIYCFQDTHMYDEDFSQQTISSCNNSSNKSSKPINTYINLMASWFDNIETKIKTYFMIDCLREISQCIFKKGKNLKHLLIENISHNESITTYIIDKYAKIEYQNIPCRYYTYNLIMREIQPINAFILL